MGYWIYKDNVTWTARVHRADSPLANCKWRGANNGQPNPRNWVYFKTLPTNLTLEVCNDNGTHCKQVDLMACDHSQCMNGQL